MWVPGVSAPPSSIAVANDSTPNATIPKLKLRMIHPARPTSWPAMASARLDRPANTATTMCGVMTTMRIYTTWRHDADAIPVEAGTLRDDRPVLYCEGSHDGIDVY